jgi:hypothetical protein
MKKELLIIASVLCLLSGCAGSKTCVLSGEIKKEVMDTVYFKQPQIIPLETNENSSLKKISRIACHDDKLFISDGQLNRIVVFNSEGKYVSHISASMEGPSAYETFMDFALDTAQKQIVVLCTSPHKTLRFDYQGAFVGEQADDPYREAIIYSNLTFFSKRTGHKFDNDGYELVDLDLNLNENKPILRNNMQNMFFSQKVADDEIQLSRNPYSSNRIGSVKYKYGQGRKKKQYVIDFTNNTLSPELFVKNEFEDKYGREYREESAVYSVADVSESKDLLLLNTNAAIFILDKDKNRMEAYKSIYSSNLGFRWNSCLPVDNERQKIASVIYPADWAEKLNEKDNPLLVLYELR